MPTPSAAARPAQTPTVPASGLTAPVAALTRRMEQPSAAYTLPPADAATVVSWSKYALVPVPSAGAGGGRWANEPARVATAPEVRLTARTYRASSTT